MSGHETTVDTTAGKLRRVTAGGVSTFLGIPYGDSVAGDRRFTVPRPHPGWTGVRDAATFGPAAPQSDPRIGCSDEFYAVLRLLYPGVPSPLEGRPMGENALVLNVWASTADTGAKPVMVWLHGGGFVHGTGAEGWFQGDRLALEATSSSSRSTTASAFSASSPYPTAWATTVLRRRSPACSTWCWLSTGSGTTSPPSMAIPAMSPSSASPAAG